MAIAISLKQYLDQRGIDYEVLPHTPTQSSIDTASAAHIPARDIAKPVILEDDLGFLMAVIPANHHIELGQLSRQLDRRLGLATEQELAMLFEDCELGAIPPLGEPYHLDVVVDDSLRRCADVYFEAGNHAELVHLRGHDFQKLMRHALHGQFSRRM
jgi:Ala-tRNA(Pro) deacylase